MAHALKARSRAGLRTQVSARAQITRSTLSVWGSKMGQMNKAPALKDLMSEKKRTQVEYTSVCFDNDMIS